jgi:hypothetical protein
MAKKRPTLDAFLTSQTADMEKAENQSGVSNQPSAGATESVKRVREPSKVKKVAPVASEKPRKPEIVRHMLYLPLPVYDQLQGLVFEEQRGQAKRRKTHDYLLDAIDLLFKKKGLKSISELVEKDS